MEPYTDLMAMNTAQKKPAKRLTQLSVLGVLFCMMLSPAFAYKDQIAMTSTEQIKTVFDVKIYALLRNLYQNNTLIEPENIIWQKAHLLSERDGYLEQLLVQKYVQDNRVDLKFEEAEWKNQAQELKDQWAKIQSKEPKAKQWSISDKQINDWMKNRYTLEAFLRTHRPFQAIVTSRKVDQYYIENKSDHFLDQPLDNIRGLVEADFKKDFLKKEFQRWVSQELRRQKWKLYNIEPST